jgi:hypothetical protein
VLHGEQFAFDEAGGQRCTIHLDQGPILSRAARVDGACDELFAGTRLAKNQHGQFNDESLRFCAARLWRRAAPASLRAHPRTASTDGLV